MKFFKVMLIVLLFEMHEPAVMRAAEYAAEPSQHIEEQEYGQVEEHGPKQPEGWGAWAHRHTVGRVQNAARTIVDTTHSIASNVVDTTHSYVVEPAKKVALSVANTAHAYTVAPVQNAMQAWHEGVTETGDEEGVSKQSAVKSDENVPLHSQKHVVIPAFNGPDSKAGQGPESLAGRDEEFAKKHKAYVLYEQKLQEVGKDVDRYKAEKRKEAEAAAQREVYGDGQPDENSEKQEQVHALVRKKLKGLVADFARYRDQKTKEASDDIEREVYGSVRHDMNFVAHGIEDVVTSAERKLEEEAERAARDIEGSSKTKQALIQEPVPAEQSANVGLWNSVIGVVHNVAGLSKGFVDSCTQLLPSLNLGVVPDAGGIDFGELEGLDEELAVGGQRNDAYFADLQAKQRAFEALPAIDAGVLAKLTQTKALLDSWTGTALRPLLSVVIPTMPKFEALISEMVTTQRVPADVKEQLQEAIAGVPGAARLAEVSGLVAGSALKGESTAGMLDAATKAFPQLLPLIDAAHDLGIAREILSKSTDPLGDLRKLNGEALKSPVLKNLVEKIDSVMTSKENTQLRTAKITAIVKQVGMILFAIALTSVVLMIASDAKDNKTLRSLTSYCLIFDVVALMGGLAYGFKRIATLTHYEKPEVAAQGKGVKVPVAQEPVVIEPAVEPAVVV